MGIVISQYKDHHEPIIMECHKGLVHAAHMGYKTVTKPETQSSAEFSWLINRGYFPKGRVRIVFQVSKFHGRTVSFKAGVTPINATFMAEVLPS